MKTHGIKNIYIMKKSIITLLLLSVLILFSLAFNFIPVLSDVEDTIAVDEMPMHHPEFRQIDLDKMPTRDDLYYVAKLYLKFPKSATSMFLLESGNMKSKLARKYNNLGGMTMPHTRKTYANGFVMMGKYPYAKYDTWVHFVKDFAEYCKRAESICETEEEFLTYIVSRNYSEAPNYYTVVNKIYNRQFKHRK